MWNDQSIPQPLHIGLTSHQFDFIDEMREHTNIKTTWGLSVFPSLVSPGLSAALMWCRNLCLWGTHSKASTYDHKHFLRHFSPPIICSFSQGYTLCSRSRQKQWKSQQTPNKQIGDEGNEWMKSREKAMISKGERLAGCKAEKGWWVW